MTDSTENATLPKSTKSKNSNSSVQIPITSISPFQFVPRDTEESELLDSVDFGGAKSTESSNSDSSVSRGTNSDGDIDVIGICTEEFEFVRQFPLKMLHIFSGNCHTQVMSHNVSCKVLAQVMSHNV